MVQAAYDYRSVVAPIDVMIVFAHPDDEIAWFGGIIPSLVDAGKSVLAVCLTRGAGGGNAAIREVELAASLWTCGLRQAPIWGDFADCGFISPGVFESVDWVWQRWGGREKSSQFVQELIQHYQPTYIFTHNPYTGDYGHPNHMASAWACVDAFDTYAAQGFKGLGNNTLRTLYICSRETAAQKINWSTSLHKFADFSGATAAEVALRALRCHKSQSVSSGTIRENLAYEIGRQRLANSEIRPNFFEKLLNS